MDYNDDDNKNNNDSSNNQDSTITANEEIGTTASSSSYSPICVRLFPTRILASADDDHHHHHHNKSSDDKNIKLKNRDEDVDGTVQSILATRNDPSPIMTTTTTTAASNYDHDTTTTRTTTENNNSHNNNNNNNKEQVCSLAVRDCRDLILQLSEPMCQLCHAVQRQRNNHHSGSHVENGRVFLEPLAHLFHGLRRLAQTARLDFQEAIYHKMALNERKYPVELCQGKAEKYTEYSASTGITRFSGQSLVAALGDTAQTTTTTTTWTTTTTTAESSSCLDWTESWWHDAVAKVVQFRQDRHWSSYHTPRNLVLALMGELGELAEVLQFAGDDGDRVVVPITTLDNLRKEMADVAIYALSLTSVVSSWQQLSQKNNDDDDVPNDEQLPQWETLLYQRIQELWIAHNNKHRDDQNANQEQVESA